MESLSFWIGQFHRKKASLVPKSAGLSLGTIEWSCPGMIKETSLSDKIRVLSRKGKPLHKETRLKTFGAQIELKTHINIAKAC